MTKLGAALREKYKSPREALRVLGLDAALLKEPSMTNADLAKKLNAISARQISVGALTAYLKPRLAMDAKVPMAKVFDGVTGATFKAKKSDIAQRIRTLSKDKLAKDASLDDVEKVLDMLDGHEVDGGDESVSEPQHNAMEAAAHGHSTLGIPEKVGKEFVSKDAGMEGLKGFLKEKGMGEDDITAACDFMREAATDADPEEEEKKKKEAEEKAAKDKAAKDAEMKDMVTKPAMDAALKATAEATAKTVRETERGIRAALGDVKPWVGDLPPSLAFDSAADVHRHALTMLGVDGAKALHADALLPVLKAQPRPGAQSTARSSAMGMDSAAVKSFADRYPDAARIRNA